MSAENPIKIYGAEIIRPNAYYKHCYLPDLKTCLIGQERYYHYLILGQHLKKLPELRREIYLKYRSPSPYCGLGSNLESLCTTTNYDWRERFLRSVADAAQLKGGFLRMENDLVSLSGDSSDYGSESNEDREQIQTKLQEFINQNRQ
jgi:hypothetical protein